MNEQALEMARCVDINIDNMIRMMPVLAAHPLLPVVKFQIRECIEALETEQPQVAGLAGLRAQYDGSLRQLTAVMAEHTETVTRLEATIRHMALNGEFSQRCYKRDENRRVRLIEICTLCNTEWQEHEGADCILNDLPLEVVEP